MKDLNAWEEIILILFDITLKYLDLNILLNEKFSGKAYFIVTK